MPINEKPGKQAQGSAVADTLATLPPPSEIAASGPEIGPGYLLEPRVSGERYDAYRGALFLIPHTRYRVAVCAEGRQWMLQSRKGRDQWKGLKYFATKRRLGTVIRETLGDTAYLSVRDQLDALPI